MTQETHINKMKRLSRPEITIFETSEGSFAEFVFPETTDYPNGAKMVSGTFCTARDMRSYIAGVCKVNGWMAPKVTVSKEVLK